MLKPYDVTHSSHRAGLGREETRQDGGTRITEHVKRNSRVERKTGNRIKLNWKYRTNSLSAVSYGLCELYMKLQKIGEL
jgi:hypothetical protein